MKVTLDKWLQMIAILRMHVLKGSFTFVVKSNALDYNNIVVQCIRLHNKCETILYILYMYSSYRLSIIGCSCREDNFLSTSLM